MSIVIVFSVASGIYTLYEAIIYTGDDIMFFDAERGYWLRYVLGICPYISLILGISGLLICLYTKYYLITSIPISIVSIGLTIFSLATI